MCASSMPAALPRWPQRSSYGIWSLQGGTRLVGAVEFQITGTDRVVHTQVVRASEPVSEELPGDLAAAAGRLLRRLASEGLTTRRQANHIVWKVQIRGEPDAQ